MANLIGGDRWVFTEPTSAAEESQLNHLHWITGIFWTSDENSGDDIAADDDLYITDGSGLKVISKRAEGTGDDLGITMGHPGLPVQGWSVKVLDGGVLTIWRKLPYT